MADANPDGLPQQSAEHVARFLVVSAREDRGLIRRSRPVAPEDFLNRVRDLPAMLFQNAPRSNAQCLNAPPLASLPPTPSAAPAPLASASRAPASRPPASRPRPDLAETPIIAGATPRAQAAAERLELAIQAADRSEQSLLAMQLALARAQRRNLVFGIASCVVVAISLGVGTMGRFHFGATASVPRAEAAAAPPATATKLAVAEATPAATTIAAADPLPVPPLPAASEVAYSSTAAAPTQPTAVPTVLADNTEPATTESSSGNQTATGGPQASISQVSDQSAQPSLIEADSGNASALLRTLPPGSIIVSPLPEPPPAPEATRQPTPPVQDVSVPGASVAVSPPKRHYVYRRPVRYYYYGPPQLLGRVVNNLGRDIRSLFH